MNSIIGRINELANKSKVGELTQGELKEQKDLRAEYIKKFRANFTNQLNHTKIKELDGTITPLKRKKVK